MVNLKFRSLYQQEGSTIHIAYEAVWTSEPVWTFRRIEKSLAFAGIGTPDRPAHGLVPVPAPVNRCFRDLGAGHAASLCENTVLEWSPTFMSSTLRCCVVIRQGVYFVVLSTAALSRRKPADSGTSHDSYSAQGRDKRDTLYLNSEEYVCCVLLSQVRGTVIDSRGWLTTHCYRKAN